MILEIMPARNELNYKTINILILWVYDEYLIGGIETNTHRLEYPVKWKPTDYPAEWLPLNCLALLT